MKPLILAALLCFTFSSCKHKETKGNAEGYGARKEAPACNNGKTADGKPCK